MWGGFEQWASPVIDVPFVARTRYDPRRGARGHWRPEGNRLALASFGGLGSALPLGPLGGWTAGAS